MKIENLTIDNDSTPTILNIEFSINVEDDIDTLSTIMESMLHHEFGHEDGGISNYPGYNKNIFYEDGEIAKDALFHLQFKGGHYKGRFTDNESYVSEELSLAKVAGSTKASKTYEAELENTTKALMGYTMDMHELFTEVLGPKYKDDIEGAKDLLISKFPMLQGTKNQRVFREISEASSWDDVASVVDTLQKKIK